MLELGAFEQRLLIAAAAGFFFSLSAIWLDPSSSGEQGRVKIH
jgi:hypothetical protein